MPRPTVFDRAKQYAAANSHLTADLQEQYNLLLDEWKYAMAVAWDAGYSAGVRSKRASKAKAKRKGK